MRNSWAVSLVASCSLLAGCAGSFEYRPLTLSGIQWQASNVSVVIQDERPVASDTLPRVPVVTIGGGQEEDMRLPSEFTEFARWRLSQIITGSGPRVRLVILPEHVRAGWHASAWSEKEVATVRLRFRVTTEDGRRVLLEGSGNAQKEVSSGDASDRELAQVFRAACNDAFDGFFASAGNIKLLNAATAPDAPAK